MLRAIRTIEQTSTVLGPFAVEFAAGSACRTDEYRLRYRVFVDERHWIAPDGLSNGLERDEFDMASCAFVLRDASSGEVAACQRMILPELLPAGLVTNIEQLVSGLDEELASMPRDSWAEVSRSSVAPAYRWGSGTACLPAMVAVKYAAIALAVAFERSSLFSLSEPRTARLTRRLGFTLHQISDPIEFHGRRAVFRIDVAEVLRSVPAGMRGILDQLIDEGARLRSTFI